MKQIVILGAGFGGINAYQEFVKLSAGKKDQAEITLIDEKDYFAFIPLIHEVATGNLPSAGLIQPLRYIVNPAAVNFIQGRVLNADFDKKLVSIDQYPVETRGEPKILKIPYDFLIIALGSETEFYNVPGASEHSLTLKTLADARKLKYLIIERFERAEGTANEEEKKKLLRFVIVGGGPTGVELAGELADLINDELHQAFPSLRAAPEIYIVEACPTILSKEEEWFRKKGKRILEKKFNVRVLLNRAVKKVTRDGVYLTDGFIPSSNVIWAAGVRAASLDTKAKMPVELEPRTKRIKVETVLNLRSYPDVFVIGDQAWICDEENHQPYPMRAQFAVREGRRAARNIWRLIRGQPLKEFHWQDKGFLVSLGKGGALARVGGIHLSGPLAWAIYRVAYLLNIIGLKAKLRTGIEWFINLFLARDIWKPK